MGRRKPAKGGARLGAAIIKQRRAENDRSRGARAGDGSGARHTTLLDDSTDRLKSVTEATDLDEFAATAALADRDFTAQRRQTFMIVNKPGEALSRPSTAAVPAAGSAESVVLLDGSTEQRLQRQAELEAALAHEIRVPRRPAWDASTTPEQLDAAERHEFLSWRRALAAVEVNRELVLTPFEKNLEVWRQLWRVIERSHVVIQIVDARNPLLFRCPDLDTYVSELPGNKRSILLVNKADLLSLDQRRIWARYFAEHKIECLFFSALAAEKAIEEEEEAYRRAAQVEEEQRIYQDRAKLGGAAMTDDNDDDGDEDGGDVDAGSDDGGKEQGVPTATAAAPDAAESTSTFEHDAATSEVDDVHVYTRDELVSFLEQLAIQGKDKVDPRFGTFMVGMVGYPNVGKSSTINVIVQSKKVAVSSTPGKTKHFQTLKLNDGLVLCDCPGLVFPSFVTTKADMVTNGILPIDQLREHNPPVDLICQRVPKPVLESLYGIVLPDPADHEDANRPPYGYELTQAFGFARGYMTTRGTPDEARAARLILKDYVNGRLLYCHAPPDLSPEDAALFRCSQIHRAGLAPSRQRAVTAAVAAAKQDGVRVPTLPAAYDPTADYTAPMRRKHAKQQLRRDKHDLKDARRGRAGVTIVSTGGAMIAGRRGVQGLGRVAPEEVRRLAAKQVKAGVAAAAAASATSAPPSHSS